MLLRLETEQWAVSSFNNQMDKEQMDLWWKMKYYCMIFKGNKWAKCQSQQGTEKLLKWEAW